MAFDTRTGGFLMITGVTFAGFASGFGDCLFDVNKVDACIAVAEHWRNVLTDVGFQIVEWATVMVRSILERSN